MVNSKLILASSAAVLAVVSATPGLLVDIKRAKLTVDSGLKLRRRASNNNLLLEVLDVVSADIGTAQTAITDLQMTYIAGSHDAPSAQKLITGVDSEATHVIHTLDTLKDPQHSEYSDSVSKLIVGSVFQQVVSSYDMALESLTGKPIENSLHQSLEEAASTLDHMHEQAVEYGVSDNLINQIKETQDKILSYTTSSQTQGKILSYTSSARRVKRDTDGLDDIASEITEAKKNIDGITSTLLAPGSSPDLESVHDALSTLNTHIGDVLESVRTPVNSEANQLIFKYSDAVFSPFIESVTKSTNTLLDALSTSQLDPMIAPPVKDLELSVASLANLAGKYNLAANQKDLNKINERIQSLFVTPPMSVPNTAPVATLNPPDPTEAPNLLVARLARSRRGARSPRFAIM